MNMTSRLKRYVIIACASFLACSAAIFMHGQTSTNVANLRTQLRAHYDIVALQDGVGLVPHQRTAGIGLIEIRNGEVAINGNAITAREARERLGKDADLILRVTYLDASAQRELTRAVSGATTSAASNQESANDTEPEPSPRRQLRRSDLVRFGGNVTVGRDEVVEGDVVVIGGSADIDGEVTRDVTVIGGSLNLGPEAVVRRDVAVIGGSLNRSPGARIDGKVDDVGVGTQVPLGRRLGRNFPLWMPFLRVGGLVGTLLRVTLLILSTLVVVALGHRFVEAIADRTAAEPLRSGFAGLLAELLFVPMVVITIVVLAVSIIGIPLLILVPFAIVLAVVPMLVGFTGVAYQVGRLASNRFGIKQGPYALVPLGVLLIVGITLIARIVALAGGFVFGIVVAGPLAAVGRLAEYVAWTMGIGAVILTWLNARRRGIPTAAVPGPTTGEAHAH
jgi:hypothetical protein